MSISKGIMKTLQSEYPNTIIMYRVMCDCSDKHHDITVSMEFDKELGMISLTFYADVEWCYWYDGFWKWFPKMWRRFKAAIRLFFIGYLEMETDFLISNPGQINDFIKALIEGKAHCLAVQAEYEAEKKGLN